MTYELTGEITVPCVLVLSRWDPEKGPRVFPSRRHRATGEAVVWKTADEVRAEIRTLNGLLAAGVLNRDDHLIECVHPDQVQAYVDEKARSLGGQATVPVEARRFSDEELRRVGAERAGEVL